MEKLFLVFFRKSSHQINLYILSINEQIWKTALLSLSHADIKNIKRINVRVTCTISHNFCALFGICSFIVYYDGFFQKWQMTGKNFLFFWHADLADILWFRSERIHVFDMQSAQKKKPFSSSRISSFAYSAENILLQMQKLIRCLPWQIIEDFNANVNGSTSS